MKYLPSLRSLVLATLMMAVAFPAFAQSNELKQILDRLQRIERDIKTLNIQVSRGEGAPAASGEAMGSTVAARIAVRLTNLEDELRATTGRVETVSNQFEQVNSRLDKLIADLDFRLSALESRGTNTAGAQQGNMGQAPNVTAAPSPPGVQAVLPGASQPGVLGVIPQSDVPPVPADEQNVASAPATGTAGSGEVTANALPATPAKPAGVLPEGTPKERYAYAFGLLRKADYNQAELALNEFMTAHPDDPLAGNARYWLAESHYVRGQYVQAAEAFVAGYQADAKGPKAPDMLLKLGMSLSNLDKKAEACASFKKLLEDFPKAPARILTKVQFESKKIECQ